MHPDDDEPAEDSGEVLLNLGEPRGDQTEMSTLFSENAHHDVPATFQSNVASGLNPIPP